ncbi:MAG: hypothetical protein DCC75_12675 [Proteobacteria bacterium]|nr:MAG: hypothetical protein DCC75_12675 [Pseudomonadota bacterium]
MNLSGSKVLVAGASGFLGGHFAKKLKDLGADVVGTTFSRAAPYPVPGVKYVTADLTRAEDCAAVCEGCDYIFMCAANTAGAAVMKATPLAHVTPNVLMNTLMLEAAHRAKVKRYLFISSGAAYPATGEVPAKEEDMFAAEPEDVYYAVAWMKRYAEILCRTYAEKIKDPMPVTVVRPSNVYGPQDKFDPAKSHVTAALIRRVAERENPMVIWGTGNDIRDLIYIDDFIDGTMAAFSNDSPFYAVNIAFGEGISVRELLIKIIEVDCFNDAKYSFDVSKPSTTPIRLLDHSKAKADLRFQAKTSLASGIKMALEWYRANLLGTWR